VIARPVPPAHRGEAAAHSRHNLLPGFDQSALTRLRLTLIGAGAAGSEAGRVLIRKGVGHVTCFDPDEAVELSNLPRQFYYPDQLYQAKALALTENLARESTAEATIEGHVVRFEDAVALGQNLSCDVAVIAVDSDPTRAFCSRFFRERSVPCIFTACSENADRAYVFIQEPLGACWGCVFPAQATSNRTYPCAGATIEQPAIVAGMIAYAVDSLVMPRRRYWNYREISLSGASDDVVTTATRRTDCPLCGDFTE
jgi:molybdopterin/thiamine biosynthesis adenylyltransferase